MDQKTQLLCEEAQEIIDSLSTKNHLKYQVKTHIDSVQATGKGKEVLKHFITVYKSHKRKYVRNKYLTKLYYFQNVILDANLIKYTYYSRCNRHKQWKPVLTVRFNDKK